MDENIRPAPLQYETTSPFQYTFSAPEFLLHMLEEIRTKQSYKEGSLEQIPKKEGSSQATPSALAKKVYRTRGRAGQITPVVDKIAIITDQAYHRALTAAKKGDAFLLPVSHEVAETLQFENGILKTSSFYTRVIPLQHGMSCENGSYPVEGHLQHNSKQTLYGDPK